MVNYADKPVHTPAAILLNSTRRAKNLSPEEKGFVARFLDGNATVHIRQDNDARETLAWADLLSRNPEALHGLMELEKRERQQGWKK